MPRRDDDPALGRRENNHRNNEKNNPVQAIKQRYRGVQIEREKRAGSRGNKKQPPPYARDR